jgi:hypothetical protein
MYKKMSKISQNRFRIELPLGFAISDGIVFYGNKVLIPDIDYNIKAYDQIELKTPVVESTFSEAAFYLPNYKTINTLMNKIKDMEERENKNLEE